MGFPWDLPDPSHVTSSVARHMGPCDRSPDHKQRQQQPTANTDPDLGPSMWLSREPNALLSLMSMPYVLGVTPALCAPPKRMKRDDLDSTLKIAMKIMSQMPALYYLYLKKSLGTFSATDGSRHCGRECTLFGTWLQVKGAHGGWKLPSASSS